MFTLPPTVLFAVLTLTGLILLVKSSIKLIAIYASAPKAEWVAQSAACYFDLSDPGIYEISVKWPSAPGILPKRTPFEVLDRLSETSIAVAMCRSRFSAHWNILGRRIVPIATFAVEQPSTFRIFNPENDDFSQYDKLLIRPKPGNTGILFSIVALCSSVLFIGSLTSLIHILS